LADGWRKIAITLIDPVRGLVNLHTAAIDAAPSVEVFDGWAPRTPAQPVCPSSATTDRRNPQEAFATLDPGFNHNVEYGRKRLKTFHNRPVTSNLAPNSQRAHHAQSGCSM